MNLRFRNGPLFRKAADYAEFSPYFVCCVNERFMRIRVRRPSHISGEDYQSACDALMRIHEQDKKIHIASEQSWVGDWAK